MESAGTCAPYACVEGCCHAVDSVELAYSQYRRGDKRAGLHRGLFLRVMTFGWLTVELKQLYAKMEVLGEIVVRRALLIHVPHK